MIVQPIGKFKLTYANGITQEDYKSIVKPILDNIAEAQRSGINKKSIRKFRKNLEN